ncbi:MAG: hypothetical protein AAFY82_10940 [Pseudomonadota bacterium]
MEGVDVVVFLTGISLVNAAMNTQLVIDHFQIEAILVKKTTTSTPSILPV